LFTSDLLALCLATMPAAMAAAEPGDIWRAWALAPETLLPLLALLAVPWLPGGQRPRRGERIGWFLGCGLLAIALVSPLCRLAATLAAAHMVQHLILILLAPAAMAPLLLRRRLPSLPPAAATLLFGALIWLAHAPPIYQAALLSPGAHLLLLAATVGLALLFWCAALAAEPLRGLGMVFATLLHSGLLGAVLTFSPRVWYPVFGSGPAVWGLTALEDQQLAGLTMWVPMGAVLLVAGLWIAGRGLRREALR